MGSQQPAIRSRPKEIKAFETYHLDMDATSSEKKLTIARNGKIEIHIPFDGNTYVDESSVDDIENFYPSYTQIQNNTRALIGYLNFQKHEKTDLDEKYSLSLKSNILPLELGIKEYPLKSIEDLIRDKYKQITTINYLPDEPVANPISFDFFVTDEILKDEFSKQILPKFERYLILAFKFSLKLPKKQIQNLQVKIGQLRINWPSIPSVDEMQIGIFEPEEGDLKRVAFDLEKKQIVVEDIKLNVKEDKYNSDWIFLKIPEPGELYGEKSLEGIINFEIPSLFSGLKMGVFSIDGQLNEELNIIYKTQFFVKFKLDIQKTFQAKYYMPSQLIQFPHVVLEEMRILDIATILRDERFSIDSVEAWEMPVPDSLQGLAVNKPQNVNNNRKQKLQDGIISRKKFEIFSSRKEGAGKLILRIVMEGRDSETRREKAIPGDEKFVTTFDTGGLSCTIQGRLNKDINTVVSVINKIHVLMKERFRHVNVLD